MWSRSAQSGPISYLQCDTTHGARSEMPDASLYKILPNANSAKPYAKGNVPTLIGNKAL